MDYIKAVLNLMVTQGRLQQDAADTLLNSIKGNASIFENVSVSAEFSTLLTQFIDGFDTNVWTVIASKYDIDHDSATFTVAANGTQKANTDLTLFKGIKVPAALTSEVFDGTDFTLANIKVTAQAIQAEDITSVKDGAIKLGLIED